MLIIFIHFLSWILTISHQVGYYSNVRKVDWGAKKEKKILWVFQLWRLDGLCLNTTLRLTNHGPYYLLGLTLGAIQEGRTLGSARGLNALNQRGGGSLRLAVWHTHLVVLSQNRIWNLEVKREQNRKLMIKMELVVVRMLGWHRGMECGESFRVNRGGVRYSHGCVTPGFFFFNIMGLHACS